MANPLRRLLDRLRPAPNGYRASLIRSYAAATVSRLTAGWTTQPKPPDQVAREELTTLRARSRDQVARNDYARRYVQLLQSNVVGSSGLALESTVSDPDGTADIQARKGVETAWKRWGIETPEVTGRLSWLDIERLAIRTAATDGEFLLRYREGRDAGPWGFQVQVLDPELLDPEHNVDLANGNAIRLGIEVDAWGAPVAYHLRTMAHGAPRDAYQVHVGRAYFRVPAEEILHAFVPEWVGQRRGIPWTATSLERLKMLGAYEEAALTHARAGAMSLGFIARQAGSTGFRGDEKGLDGDTILNMESGEWNELPPGASIEAYDPKYPSGEFRPFIAAVLKGIAAGLGPAYTTLAQDLEGTSYAGGRMGLLEERELYKYLQTWMAGAVHRRVFVRWLQWALLMGKVTHPATGTPFPSRRLDKFQEHQWRGRRWPWVDPRNDAMAAELMVANGLTTESRLMRELGSDPTEVWEEREVELEERRRRGLVTKLDAVTSAGSSSSSNGSGPNGGPPQDEDTRDPDEALVAANGRE